MLSYRHGFHAGNFADVFKHCLLVYLLVKLKLVPLGLRNQITDIAVVWGVMEGEVAIEEVYDHDTGNVIWENHDGDWTDIDNILTSTLLMYGDLEQTIGELI